MKKNLTRLLSVILLLATLLSLAACSKEDPADPSDPSNPADPSKPAEPVVYTRLYSSEIETMNYLTSSVTDTQTVFGLSCEPLLQIDNYGIIRPCLATEYTVSDDGLVYTFKLRQGVKWYTNEGKEYAELTAEDFVASAKYKLTPEYNTSYLMPQLKNGEEYYKGEVTDFAQVGIKALDKYTVEYTLKEPCTYFTSLLSRNGLWACAPKAALEEYKEQYGTAADKFMSCGAYIMQTYDPEFQRVLVKNENYWNADKISIDKMVFKYNKEATAVGPELFLRGETDYCKIDNATYAAWSQDPEKLSQVHPMELTNMTYGWYFNFDPTYDEQYKPSDWKIAVNNENFRQAFFYGFDRYAYIAPSNANNYEGVAVCTVSKRGMVNVNGKDYWEMGGLDKYATAGNLFDEAKAKQYKDAAMKELAGKVTFPIQVVVPFNGDSASDNQVVFEQQLERTLGKDFIDVILQQVSVASFSKEIRNVGKWSMYHTGWGPDYEDPMDIYPYFLQSRSGKNFGKMYLAEEYYDAALGYGTFEKMYNEANKIVLDLEERYEAFAEAECFILDHALFLPTYQSGGTYLVDRIVPFTGLCKPGSLSSLKYAVKGEESVSAEEYKQLEAAWYEARNKALAEEAAKNK